MQYVPSLPPQNDHTADWLVSSADHSGATWAQVAVTLRSQARTGGGESASPLDLTQGGRLVAQGALRLMRPVLMPVGLLATLTNVLVFRQPAMRSSAASYVIAISVGQLVILVLSIIQQIITVIIINPLTDYYYWLYDVYVINIFTAIAKRGSYVIMCLMASERLYAILRPLHVRDFICSRHPRRLSLATYALSTIMHAYIPAKTTVGAVKSKDDSVVYLPLVTRLYLEHANINDAFSLTAKILLVFLPLAMLILLAVLTARALRRHVDVMARVTSLEADSVKRRQRERQLTALMLTATACFVVLSLPYAGHFLCSTLFPETYSLDGPLKNLYNVVLLTVANLTFLSCTVDFCCFLLASSRYRSTLLSLVTRCCCCRGRPAAHCNNTTSAGDDKNFSNVLPLQDGVDPI